MMIRSEKEKFKDNMAQWLAVLMILGVCVFAAYDYSKSVDCERSGGVYANPLYSTELRKCFNNI